MDPLTLALVVVGLLVGTVLVLRTPRLAPPGPLHGSAGPPASVVVVIPAHDEQEALPALLRDLAGQDRPAERTVVVDDGSHDATARVAARAGVEVRSAGSTPAGWNPKSWALHQGLVDADEDVVVFLDADVRLAPDALGSVLAQRTRHQGLVSVAPRHDVGRWVEAVSLPFNLVAVMGAGGGASARTPSARAAFGPLVAVGRSAYEAVGGHAAIRGELLDDVALAHLARSAGQPVSLFRGGDRVRYRMYRGGLRQILDGWTKNIAAGATRTAPVAAVGSGLWVTAVLVPLVAAVSSRDATGAGAAVALWAVVAAHTAWLARTVGRFGVVAAVAAPLLAAVFVAVVARSAWALVLRRPVRWKGRDLVQARGEVSGG